MKRTCDDCKQDLHWNSPHDGFPGDWRHDNGVRAYEYDDATLRHDPPVPYEPWPDEERLAYYKHRENVTYTDGTQVQAGDKARYHQAPGGLMPHGDWKYGVIVAMPAPHPDATEYVLRDDENGRLYNLFSHVIERV